MTRRHYIRYADGSEELYDHDGDPNEWAQSGGRSAIRREDPRTRPLAAEARRPARAGQQTPSVDGNRGPLVLGRARKLFSSGSCDRLLRRNLGLGETRD
jgi:hypothetical protein